MWQTTVESICNKMFGIVVQCTLQMFKSLLAEQFHWYVYLGVWSHFCEGLHFKTASMVAAVIMKMVMLLEIDPSCNWLLLCWMFQICVNNNKEIKLVLKIWIEFLFPFFVEAFLDVFFFCVHVNYLYRVHILFTITTKVDKRKKRLCSLW